MMRLLRRAWRRLLGTLPARSADADLAEELESHIAMLADENVRRGMTPEEADRRARIKFGNVEVMKEHYRDQRGLPFIDTTLQDLRYAGRVLRKNRGFTAVAVLSLATGIGANTAIFSLVNTVLLQPLPYRDPERLFGARTTAVLEGAGAFGVNPAQALAWQRESPSLEAVALMRPSRGQVSAGTEPILIQGGRVTHNFFAVLGVEPMLGRTFLPEEDAPGRTPVVILTESLWRARFNADASSVGRSVMVDGIHHLVVGVVRGTFWRSMTGGRQVSASDTRMEFFRPLALSTAEQERITGNYNYAAVVRVKPGVSVEQALAEINVLQARVPRPPGEEGRLRAVLIPLHEIITGRSSGLWLLTAAVGAVLLIVCMNLANLSLSRVAARRRETAVRSALGASRARQFRQALTESLVLSVAGGALGILVATWLVQLVAMTTPIDLPRLDQLRVDPVVLAFALAVTLMTAVLFGILPAWRLTRQDPNQTLRTGSHPITEGRSALRLREGLIGLEVSVSTALLIVAALLTASLDRLLSVDKGFTTDRILTFTLDTAGPRYEDAEVRDSFFARVMDQLAAIPGVEAAGLTIQLPLEGNTWNDPIYHVENGARSERHSVENRYASPGYFAAMNIVLVHGRVFDDSDRGRSVAMLSQKAARILWPDDPNPVGRQFMRRRPRENAGRDYRRRARESTRCVGAARLLPLLAARAWRCRRRDPHRLASGGGGRRHSRGAAR